MAVDEKSLRSLMKGAKVTSKKPLPFDDLDPDAPADRNMRFRTNAYERALFHYVAGLRGQGESMQSFMRAAAREAALAELAKER